MKAFYNIIYGKFTKTENLTNDERDALKKIAFYTLVKDTGMGPREIAELPVDWFDDFLTIGNFIKQKEKENINTIK